MGRRVAVTGIGLVSPCGLDRETTWSALVQGRSGIAPISRFDASALSSRIAGEVRGFDPLGVVERRELPTHDLFQLYALKACLEAAGDAALGARPCDPGRFAVVLGVGLGGIGSLERYHAAFLEKGPRRVSPYLVPMMIPNMAPSKVAMRLGAKGPCHAIATACASGAHAIGEGARLVREGHADVVVAGGAEAAVTPLGVAAFCAMRALSSRNDEPEAASRPFDMRRDGFVIAEGAAAVVLEAEEIVASRAPRRVYSELAGYGSTGDAYHVTQPDPQGSGQVACMRLALSDAAAGAEQVGYVNAHGTGTPLNDHVEAAAIREVLGGRWPQVPASSTKSMTGHMLGASGALEAAVCALVIDRGVLPPTINLDAPDPECALCHVAREARQGVPVDLAITNSFGFGGTNATLVLRRWRERDES